MAKIQRRKPAKRKPGRPKIDDSLVDLALALDEARGVDSIDGWLSVPWRSGWNAVWFACNSWRDLEPGQRTGDREESDLQDWFAAGVASSYVYEQADELMRGLAELAREQDHLKLLIAGARCVQLLIAASSGGGHGYNDVLRVALHRQDLHANSSRFEAVKYRIKQARCLDSIHATLEAHNDHNDKLRSAFSIAWDRGLYQAAYALPRAK